MAYDITQLKADLSSVLHGTTTNQITNLNGLIYRAAREVLEDCDPMETKRIASLGVVFTDVWDYSCPTDLKGNRIIDIYPQVNRATTDIVQQTYNQAFDISKTNSLLNDFTIQFNTSVKTLRLNTPTITPAPVIVNDCSSTTSNGTWTAGGNAGSLTTDYVNYVSNAGSLEFNLSAGGAGSTGYLENSTMSALNLSLDVLQGRFFLYTYLPTGSSFSKVNLRIGSSASNYYSMDATVTQASTAFANGWNLLSFPWANATTVGTPVSTALNYIRITWTYDGTLQTGVHLDQVSESLGQIMMISYYSKDLFRNSSTGAYQETILTDSDLINLDTESFNLLTYKVAELAVQQQQGLDAIFYDGQYFQGKYTATLQRYMALYKSEVQKPKQTYYGLPRPRRITTGVRFGF